MPKLVTICTIETFAEEKIPGPCTPYLSLKVVNKIHQLPLRLLILTQITNVVKDVMNVINTFLTYMFAG